MLASILATFHLKEIGVKEVYAKALSSEHERILRRIGADRILFPEKDLALSLARRIANPNMIEYLPFIADHGIFELGPPESFVGKTLRDLDLINRYGIQVIAIRDGRSGDLIFIPKADFVIRKTHVLILLGPNKTLDQLSKESGES
jgi:trk system potassium uptake protein TrkA